MKKQNKNIRQLQKVYDKIMDGGLKYFSETSAQDNLLMFMTCLAYLRDYKIICAAETNADDDDGPLTSLQDALNEYAAYYQLTESLNSIQGIAENTAEVVAERDTHYRKMWEIISHNFEEWFE